MSDEARERMIEPMSFAQFRDTIKERSVTWKCEVCGQDDKGWTLFSESAEGNMVEMVTLSQDTEMAALVGPARGWQLDFMRRNLFFAVICRHCGHTRLHHKATLLGDLGDAS